MTSVLADEPKGSPHSTHGEACEKCQYTDCFSLHGYDPTSCSCQTCKMCLELGKVDAQILKAHNLLIYLSKKRHELKGRTNHHHDRIIHRLPVEIIAIIFRFYAKISDDIDMKPNRSQNWTAPLTLGSVCRRWRDITLGMPQLWTKVVIDPWKHANSLDITMDWLSRSRTFPLSMTIKRSNLRHVPPFSTTLPLRKLFQFLQSVSGRCETLDLNLPSRYIHLLLDDLENDLHLDYLRIEDADCIGNEMEQIETESLLVPKCFIVRNISIANIPMEWSKLTQLHAYYISVDELVHIIDNATNLETCIAYDIKEDEANYSLPDSPIVNSSLKHLGTAACSFEMNFLRHVTLPALDTLIYTFYGNNEEDATDVFSDFMDRSEPSLHPFSLSYRVDPLQSESWFDSFPSVTRLELIIDDPGASHAKLEGFILEFWAASNPPVFPLLEELTIITPSMSPECWLHLSEAFAEDYIEPAVTRPLLSLHVHLQTRWTGKQKLMTDYVYDRFHDIKAGGVQIRMIGGDGVDLLDASEELYGQDFGLDEEPTGESSEDDGSGDEEDEEEEDGSEDDDEEDDEESGDEEDV